MGAENMNLEWVVTQEALWHQMLPYKLEPTLQAMEYFGGFDMTMMRLYAIAGAVVALLILYGIGWILSVPLRAQRRERYAKLQQMLRYPALILPLFASAPVGFAIIITTGILRAPAWQVLPVGTIGLIAAYML